MAITRLLTHIHIHDRSGYWQKGEQKTYGQLIKHAIVIDPGTANYTASTQNGYVPRYPPGT